MKQSQLKSKTKWEGPLFLVIRTVVSVALVGIIIKENEIKRMQLRKVKLAVFVCDLLSTKIPEIAPEKLEKSSTI